MKTSAMSINYFLLSHSEFPIKPFAFIQKESDRTIISTFLKISISRF